MNNLVPFQTEFSQELPHVIGNVDYTNFRDLLGRISEIIELAGLDDKVMSYAISEAKKTAKETAAKLGTKFKGFSLKEYQTIQSSARQALRCGISRKLTQESYRTFSAHIADSPLLQTFCLVNKLGVIKVPGKSQLQRYEQMLPEDVIRKLVVQLNQASQNQAKNLKLEVAVSLNDAFIDTTCLSANIHFPVDWLLLRDATKTLMKATLSIRNAGLKNRMEAPAEFISRINKLCMQMTHCRRKKEGRAERKRVLRLMKKVMKVVRGHAEKHLVLLKTQWQETDLTEAQANQIIKRLENVLNKLPKAVEQAHERIIGERPVKNSDKTLSLYESDIHVIVRGKAGAEVEFGNTLAVCEQREGLIIDWKLYKDKSPGDTKILPESLDRISEYYAGHQPNDITADRGFFSKTNQATLTAKTIENHMCPRSVSELREKLNDKNFLEHQKRRGQTEGRVGILKNDFLGAPLLSKGFENREKQVAWAMLAHNLWVLARLPQAKEAEDPILKAA